MSDQPTTVRVTAAASTANLGPGFDSLGLALGLRNRIELSPADRVAVEVQGEGADRLPRGGGNLVLRAANMLYQALGEKPPPLSLRAENAVPLGSGLGSSAAAVVSGLVAANVLSGGRLERGDLLRLAEEIEGHADNAAAALYGGLVIVAPGSQGPLARTVAIPPMQVAVTLPEMELATHAMRRALPELVPLADAAFNVGRAALVVEALRTGDYELLARAMEDRLHQPYRVPFLPGYGEVEAAARRAGAAAVALSGAGPAVVAFAPVGHEAIARAMAEAFRAAGVEARQFVLPVDVEGTRVEGVD